MGFRAGGAPVGTAGDFANKGEQYHTAYADLLTFSFGRVEKVPGENDER